MNAINTVFQSVNPVSNDRIKEYPLDTWDVVLEKMEKSKDIFKKWKNFSYKERAACFFRAAEVLKTNVDTYAACITAEMGKPIVQAVAEVNKCALVCEYYASHAEAFLKDEIIETEFKKSYVHYQPLGTILQIMPWNFPFWQVFRFAAPALMAGNVTLLKHAPNVLGSAEFIQEVFDKAGFPEGVFQHLTIDVDMVEKLAKNPIIQGVALTGSVQAGAAVGALAGKNIKNCILELGGSDAFIVLKDADLEKAAQVAVQSRMHNSGQTCISAKRFIVEETVIEEFKTLVKEKMRQLVVGNPLEESTKISALARRDLAEKLQDQVDQSIHMGAVVEVAGGHKKGTNYFYPMLLSNIQKGMPAYEEELFGPVALLFTVGNVQEAIQLANDSAFGLAATIWTKDEKLAVSVAQELEVGAVAINKLMSSDPRIPFGGIKKSGVGRELGREGLMGFVNLKSIVIGD